MKQARLKELDLRTQLRGLYGPSPKAPQIVTVPRMSFIMVDGEGDPNSPSFQEAIGVLYNIAFTTKFKVRKEQGVNYPVMPMEGLWWSDEAGGFDPEHRNDWRWTVMIMQPELVTSPLIGSVKGEITKKKGIRGLERARLESFNEGLSAQMMHVGPYSAEGPTIRRLLEYIKETGHSPRGKHHEIYMGDPRRTAPAKLRTIVRHPMKT